MRRLALALLVCAALPGLAAAQPVDPPGAAERQALGVLGARDRALLAPYLAEGPVLLVEFSTDTELPAVLFATRVHAPAEAVAAVVSDPNGYPAFMPALDEIAIESRSGSQTAYRWRWQIAVFTLEGHNTMTVYPGSPRRGYRIGVTSTNGDMGEGRMTWRIYPQGTQECLLVLSSRVDMRRSNWLAEQMNSGGNSVNRTINTALSSIMVMGTKAEAERRAGYEAPPREARPLERPRVDVNALTGLLGRGDLVFLRMNGNEVEQATVLGRMGARLDETRTIMRSPEEFGRSLIQGSQARVIPDEAPGTLFEWRIPLPLVGIQGRMRLQEEGSTIEVDGESGALSASRWRYDTHEYPWGEAAVIGWAQFDPRDTARLVRRLIDDDPYFGIGLVAATQVMVIRSLRSRVLRRDEYAHLAE